MPGIELPPIDDGDKNSSSFNSKNKPLSKTITSKNSPKKKKELDYFEKKKRDDKRKVVGASAGALLLVGGIVGGLVFFDPFDNNLLEKQETEQVQTQGVQISPGEDSSNNVTADFTIDDQGNFNPPVKLEKWQNSSGPGLDGLTKEESDGIKKFYSKGEFGYATGAMGKESAGFTSDPKKQLLPDKTLNPLYTYVTAEDYRLTVGYYIESFINPLYGNWDHFQYPESKDKHDILPELFQDFFVPDWTVKNFKKPVNQYIPIYADWNGNDYGMSKVLVSDGPRWIGKVTKTKTELNYDMNTLQYTSKVTANITYSSWTKTGEVVKKKGVLTLNLVTNTTPTEEQPNKILIKDATLKMEK